MQARADDDDDENRAVESYVSLLEAQKSAPQEQRTSLSFFLMTGYCGVCALSLAGGAVAGSRSFESSAAHEALDKLPAATAVTEAQAMKYAVRALGLGTALCVGSAVVSVGIIRWVLDIRTMADVHIAARRTLGPFDQWLRANGSRIENAGKRMGAMVPDVGLWTRRALCRGGWASSESAPRGSERHND
ncbi:hypothetical protein AB1Y20_001413 [Prymnesium parvum]|uniref:Transmembrane protein 242 n=1 Tax=Prymnesium parvum TaxID=97485 RepID=A0AB34KAT8_PRYPA